MCYAATMQETTTRYGAGPVLCSLLAALLTTVALPGCTPDGPPEGPLPHEVTDQMGPDE